MITHLKKTFTVLLIIFLSSLLFSAENVSADYDDIFANQKIEKNDFYTILVEPSKKEIQEQNNKFFEEVKQKKLEILRKKQKEIEKKESAKSKVLSQKEKQKAELEKQKEILKNKKNNPSVQKAENKQENESKNNLDDKKVNKTSEKTEKQSEKAESKQQSNQKTKPLEQKKSEKTKNQQNESFQKIQNNQTEKIEENFETQEDKAKNEEELDFSIQLRKKFIDCGMDFKGIKYVWGGKTPNPGFDCSGFVTYTAKKSLDLDIKGNAQDIYNQTTPVTLNEAQPGDLIFFKGDTDTRITHVGIYLGENPEGNDFGKQNLFLNAASAGPRTGIVISGLNENYWKKTYYGCGRLLPSI